MSSSPGWYPDPSGRFEFRYHNGERWTSDVSADGVRYVDRNPPDRPKGTTASLVLGIVGIATAWMPVFFVIAVVCGTLAIVLATRARGGVVDEASRRILRAGLWCGIVALALSVVGLWFSIVLQRAVERYRDPEPNTADITSCVAESGDVVRASGFLTNDSPSAASFTVRVEVAGTTSTIETGRLEPGATEEFTVRRDASGSVDCRVIRVDGPLPLGVDVD
ncbi:MAG: DUF2510 domain-containing protein [Actinomycetota bacterium]|nr:DUF2510 domain-containing protein [Actinomycetota bacterium]